MKYRTLVVDPPWPYRDRSVNGAAEKQYVTTPMDEIASIPVGDWADAEAHLYIWTTNAFMVEAHELARAWGFTPKVPLTWTKTHQGDPSRVSMKVGYYFRGATEHLLFCVRGSLPLQTSEGLPTGYLWPRLPHSVKPDAFYDLVEKASPGPYVELFARRARFGWDYWGDQSLGTAVMA